VVSAGRRWSYLGPAGKTASHSRDSDKDVDSDRATNPSDLPLYDRYVLSGRLVLRTSKISAVELIVLLIPTFPS
jgi:hypothetical protein